MDALGVVVLVGIQVCSMLWMRREGIRYGRFQFAKEVQRALGWTDSQVQEMAARYRGGR